MARVHWLPEVPGEIRSHDPLMVSNYEDLFYGPPAPSIDMSPEAWAAVLQRAPARLRRLLRMALFTQRRILGLRLRRHSAAHLLGWNVAERGDHWFRLEASSWMGEAHLVFHSDERHVSVATFLRYDRPIGKVIWAPVAFGHRMVGLALLSYVLNASTLRLSRRLSTV